MSSTQLPTTQEGDSVTEEGLPRAVQKRVGGPDCSNDTVATVPAARERPSISATTTRTELTPSDLTLLKRIPWSNEELNGVVQAQVKLPPDEVIRSALATALLANEEAGALRLEVVRKKHFFGWFTSTTVRAVRVGNAVGWPTGSLESSLGKTGSVSDIVYSWIGATVVNPWAQVGTRIMDRMVDRGLLDRKVVRKRFLKLFTRTFRRYVLPGCISTLVTGPPTRLLGACQQTRPDVHEQLMSEIDNGFSRRTQSAG